MIKLHLHLAALGQRTKTRARPCHSRPRRPSSRRRPLTSVGRVQRSCDDLSRFSRCLIVLVKELIEQCSDKTGNGFENVKNMGDKTAELN